MFKSRDLSTLALFFIMFRNDKPVDWLLTELAELKYCRTDKDPKDCRKRLVGHWLYFRPSMFQHIGTHSSLKGKVQKLKDRNFGKVNLFKPHKDNPPADVTTSLNHYKAFSIQRAYEGDSMFWGYSPSSGDHILFDFKPAVLLSNYLFRSGNNEHPDDKIPVNSTIEIQPLNPLNLIKGSSSLPSMNSSPSLLNPSNNWSLEKLIKSPDDYFLIGLFKSNGMAEGQVPPGLGPIKSLRIKVSSDSQKWAMLSEVSIMR